MIVKFNNRLGFRRRTPICKNPNHGHWKIAVWQPELYTLDWLADFLDLNAVNDKEIVADYGLGRNCSLFDKTRKWAYRAIRQGWPEYEQWQQSCYERASAYNLKFDAPLDDSEVKSIAKSIAKWTMVNFTSSGFEKYVKETHRSEVQSLRGAKGGVLGGKISKGGGRPKTNKEQPWALEGVSRATWYRNGGKKKSQKV